jgi:hypothetical protein
MGCNLSFHYSIFIPVWRAVISSPIVPENTFIDHFPGSLDNVYRSAVYRFNYPPVSGKKVTGDRG